MGGKQGALDALKIVTVNRKNHRPERHNRDMGRACLQVTQPMKSIGRNEFVLTKMDTCSHFHNDPCQPTEMKLVIV